MNMTVRLKVYVERGVSGCGCCGCLVYGPEEKASFPEQQERAQSVGALLRALRDRYGDRLEVFLVDPRNILALWDTFRFRIRPALPAWILGRRKIFEGIPDLKELQALIDAELDSGSASQACA
jgi:hypothetical protein